MNKALGITREGDEIKVDGMLAGYVNRVDGGWHTLPGPTAAQPRLFADEGDAIAYVVEAHEFACIAVPGYRR